MKLGRALDKIFSATVTPKSSRTIELDFVRGVAILLVMGFHLGSLPTNNLFFQILQYPGETFGWAGVDLFFVLSGFLVGGLLMKEYKRTKSINARGFILRRGLKIWPAYYVFLLVQLLFGPHPVSSYLWQNLLHVQNYVGTSISHTWSLAVEEHFYLLLATGMGWVASRRWAPERMLRVFLTLMVVGMIVRTACYFKFGALAAQWQTHNRLDSLICGVALALLFHLLPDTFRSLSERKLALASVVCGAVIFLITNQSLAIQSTIGFTVAYIGAAAFLLLVYSHSKRYRTWLIYRLIARIGVYSYGIYLYHESIRRPCEMLVRRVPETFHWPTLILLEYAAAILLGVVMTRTVEWPLLRYRDRVLPQRFSDIGSPSIAK